MEQISILPNATPEQQQAVLLHAEIVSAAQVAASALVDLGRKLKRMRDGGHYKALGFDTFGAYTEAAVGIKQRQAYNYIQVVESLPARLIEENAAAGVTKLALLAKLAPDDREDLTGETLANITVAELKKIVEERDALSHQLTMFQQEEPAEVVAEVEAEPLDVDAIRAAAIEETRREMAQAQAEQEMRIRQELAAEKAEAVAAATQQAEKAAAAEIRKAKAEATEKAKEETAKQVAQARDEAAKEAAEKQAAKDREALQHSLEAEAAAREQAEALAKQLQLKNDEDSVKFALLFEQMTDKVDAMQALTEDMRADGKAEQADKLMAALRGALAAVLAELEGGADDVG